MPLTRDQRAFYGRMGAHAVHARYDARDLTAAARAKFLERFEDEVDPERKLPADERARRAEHARKLYFSRLRMKRGKGAEA
jgi:hypothetical protein